MSTIQLITLVVLAVAGLLCGVRLVRGPSFADRGVALDTIFVIVAGAVAVDAAVTGSGKYLDVLVVASLLGFVSTTLIARFIERRGAR